MMSSVHFLSAKFLSGCSLNWFFYMNLYFGALDIDVEFRVGAIRLRSRRIALVLVYSRYRVLFYPYSFIVGRESYALRP